MKARLTQTLAHTPRGFANWVRHYAHENLTEGVEGGSLSRCAKYDQNETTLR